MKICMVAWSFYPRVGGSVTTVMQLSEALVEKGVDVEIAAPILQKDIYRIKELNLDKRIKIHWVISSFARSYSDFYSRVIFFLKMTTKIRRISRDIDIFHSHDFNIGLASAIIGTDKAVVSVFGADPLFEVVNYNRKKCINYKEFLNNRVIIWLQKLMNIFISFVSKRKLIVIGCNGHSNEIIKRYYSGPVANIPVGIGLGLYKKDEIGEKAHENIILFVARFVCWKGLDLAVDVLDEVKKREKNVRMICIGDGPLREYYVNKYKDRVDFILNLDYKGAIEYYKMAKILLVTSQYETFGINILEAMAAGLPIVASDLDVFHDRLTDDVNCYLVGNGKNDIFVDRALDLLNNKNTRERFVINSFDIVKNYSIDKICDKYIRLYSGLL